MLPRVAEQIPAPQREALEIALLLRPAGDEPPTAHAIGLALLTALRACVSEGPVLVAVDDVQWLDQASLDALAFALRRVASGPLSLLVAARTEAAADPLTAGAPPPSRAWQALLAAVPAAEVIDLAPLDMWQVQNLLPRRSPPRRPGWWPGGPAAIRSGPSRSASLDSADSPGCRRWRAR